MNHIAMTTADGKTITAARPTEEDIDNLKVGDVAPFVFGESPVMQINYIGRDVNGRKFVCYYVAFGDNASMSASMKAGEVVRTLQVCNAFKSHEISRYDVPKGGR